MPSALLDAIRADLSGRQKLVAYEVWPGANDAEARMSKALKGEINLPAELIEQAVFNGHGRTVAYLVGLERGDPAQLRKEALAEIVKLRGQLELRFEQLQRADELEADRKPPHRRMARADSDDEPRRGRAQRA